MKNWLQERLPLEDWEVEQFTAEDALQFHNQFTHNSKLLILNNNIKEAKIDLAKKRKTLGIVSILFAISCIASIFFIMALGAVAVLTYTTLEKVNAVSKARELLKWQKEHLFNYIKDNK